MSRILDWSLHLWISVFTGMTGGKNGQESSQKYITATQPCAYPSDSFTKRIYRFSLLLCGMLFLTACTWTHPPAYQLPDSSTLVAGERITVKPGDNLYTIAQRYHVRINEIIVVNDMQPPYRVKPGQTICLPEKAVARAPSYDMAPTPLAAPINDVYKKPLAVETQPLPLVKAPNADRTMDAKDEPPSLLPEKITPQQNKTNPAEKEEDAAEEKKTPQKTQLGVPPFVWPVRGTIVSTFGPKGKGRDNDGVNIAAPLNAPVKAAEDGVVVYADNKMKGFGNLVLIRHENGWVTAYAHLNRILVVRDKSVSKGSVIGTVGTSGGVVSPQLHFETRRDGKPTDPELVVR